jgi:hypothetical protein
MNTQQHYSQNSFNSNDRRETVEENSDSDIVEITASDSEERDSTYHSKKFHKSDEIDEDTAQALKRWNVKKLANINRNFGCSNYKLRCFQDTRPYKPRDLIPGVFVFDDSEKRLCEQQEKLHPSKSSSQSSQADNENNIIDSLALISRIEEIQEDLERVKETLDTAHQESIQSLKSMVGAKIQNFFYQDTLNKLKQSYLNKVNEVQVSAEHEVHALESLFNSRNYELGRLNEYRRLDAFKPEAKRFKRSENCHEVVLLPLRKIKNLLIEEEIYKYYYPQPKK